MEAIAFHVCLADQAQRMTLGWMYWIKKHGIELKLRKGPPLGHRRPMVDVDILAPLVLYIEGSERG